MRWKTINSTCDTLNIHIASTMSHSILVHASNCHDHVHMQGGVRLCKYIQYLWHVMFSCVYVQPEWELWEAPHRQQSDCFCSAPPRSPIPGGGTPVGRVCGGPGTVAEDG